MINLVHAFGFDLDQAPLSLREGLLRRLDARHSEHENGTVIRYIFDTTAIANSYSAFIRAAYMSLEFIFLPVNNALIIHPCSDTP